jgi:hypothetical protein
MRLILFSLLLCATAGASVILDESFVWTDPSTGGRILFTSTVLDIGAQHEFRYTIENIDFYPEDLPGIPGDYLTGLNLFYLRGGPSGTSRTAYPHRRGGTSIGTAITLSITSTTQTRCGGGRMTHLAWV